MMETAFRSALLAWLRADPALLAELNDIAEEAPSRATAPWLGIAASASTDWSTKDRAGHELRLALELAVRGDDPATGGALIEAVQARIEAMPPGQTGFHIASATFLRGRAEKRPGNMRNLLVEYRFRLLAD